MASSQTQDLHFVLIPVMSQSFHLPMLDLANLLAQNGVTITVITTPLHASKLQAKVDRWAKSLNLRIKLISVYFPGKEAGLPEGCESTENLPSLELVKQFLSATYMMEEPVEKLIASLEPKPSCIITSSFLPWAARLAQKLNLPRYLFHHISTFALACAAVVLFTRVDETASSDTEPFLVPDLPHKIEVTRAQMPDLKGRFSSDIQGTVDQINDAEFSADGVLVNSFDELDWEYAAVYRKFVKKFWGVGPLVLCNKDQSDKIDRGYKATIDEHYCLKWLDSKNPSSVIYAAFGSLCQLQAPQLIELALGLEGSKSPFIWVIREENYSAEFEKWMAEEKFEERNKENGLVIRGWAPQILIFSHPAVGGFLTHTGWNSVVEAMVVGVPLITWPMSSDQFYNEKFVCNVMKNNVSIGVEVGRKWEKQTKFNGVLVRKENIKGAIEKLVASEEIRKRAKELEEMAKRATGEGGSSRLNVKSFIQDVLQKVQARENSTQQQSDQVWAPSDRNFVVENMKEIIHEV